MTPVKSYADLTALRSMPGATIHTTAKFTRGKSGRDQARVTLTNTSKSIAFFLRLEVVGRDAAEALPVFWDDNYVTLLPGETRVVSATYRARDLSGEPRVVVSGWNVR